MYTRKKVGQLDPHQIEIHLKNRQSILFHLNKKGFDTVSNLAGATELTRKTVYKHLKKMISENIVVKDKNQYYLHDTYLRKLIQEHEHRLQTSGRRLVFDNDSIRDYLLNEPRQGLIPNLRREPDISSPTRKAKYALWRTALNASLYNTGFHEDMVDLELFMAVQHLIHVLLRTSNTKPLGDSQISMHIFFDLPKAISYLQQFNNSIPYVVSPNDFDLQLYLDAAFDILNDAQ